MTHSNDIDEHIELLRVAWLLFSDINTRFNLLSDECAHLQDTIFGFLEHTDNKALGTNNHQEKMAGKERPWVASDPRRSDYYHLPSQERALINLWNTVGSLAQGLETNRQQVFGSFQRLVQSIRSGSKESDELYWFAAQRSHFLHAVFRLYTSRIAHTHQKLVQLLENMPGSLPNPLLLRRWSSAAYGEFLSEYSRHVNWQTQVLTWTLLNGDISRDEDYKRFEDWRRAGFLTHTWDHIPTSRAQKHTIPLSVDGKKTEGRFGSIWSAFFYLEQPILFPLLYHECAHLNLDDVQAKQIGQSKDAQNTNDKSSSKRKKFFDARTEAAETLAARVPFEEQNVKFWHQFTDEVWADAISIVLGGTGYITALFLQLFAESAIGAYNRFDTENDELEPLTDLGTFKMETREVPWPINEHVYFSEARFRIAIKVMVMIHGDSPWLQSLRTFMERWENSYTKVHAAAKTSQLHETLSTYHVKLNGYVSDICFSCLKVCEKELKAYNNLESIYDLDNQNIVEMIQNAIGEYQDKVLRGFCRNVNVVVNAANLPERMKLEDVSFLVRWHLSEFVAQYIAKCSNFDDVCKFIETYSTYMRNDGSSAFRLGLEWCGARKELYDAAGDIAVTPSLSLPSSKKIIDDLKGAVEKDIEQTIISRFDGRNCSEEDKKEIRQHFSVFLRRKQYSTNKRHLPDSIQCNIEHTKESVEKHLAELLQRLKWSCPEKDQIRVGTLYLGVIRPWEMSLSGSNKDLYGEALRHTESYFANIFDLLENDKTACCPPTGFRSTFLPLIGDYSFVNYLFGVTPSERDCHPPDVPKMLTKPRLVLEVFRGGESSFDRLEPKQSLRPPDGYPIGRISLLRFRYRWQWLDICKLLEDKKHELHPILFLSSGWEDAILITWHKNERDYWEGPINLRQLSVKGIDCQSNVIFPSLSKSCATTCASFPDMGQYPDDTWVNHLREGKYESGEFVTKYANERTGRYDYTVVWRGPDQGVGTTDKNNEEGCKLIDFANILHSLPPWFWKRVRTISTSFECSTPPAATEADVKYEIVSHILMRS